MLSVHFGVFESEDYVFDPDMHFRIASQSQERHDRRRVCNEAYRLFSPSVEGAIVPEYLQHHLSAWEAKSCRDARYP
jgi:hypothetical protein